MRGLLVALVLVAISGALALIGFGHDDLPHGRPPLVDQPASTVGQAPATTLLRTSVEQTDETPRGASLVVRVRYDDGHRGTGLPVVLNPPKSDPRVGVLREATDDQGVCRFVGLAAGRWFAHIALVHDSPEAAATLDDGETAALELVIPVMLHIRGRVVDPASTPVPGAEVLLGPMATRDHDADVVAVADREGNFEVRSGCNPVVMQARASGYGPSRMVMVEGPDRTEREDLQLMLQAKGGDVHGRVTGRHGEASARATVRIGGGRLDGLRPRTDPLPGQAWTDAQGRYALRGMPPGLQPMTVRSPGWAIWKGTCHVAPGEAITRDVVLSRGGTVAGKISTTSGAPIAGATVSLGEVGTLSFTQSVSDAAGDYRVDAVAAGAVLLAAQHARFGKRLMKTEVHADATAVCDIVLDPGRVLAGRIVSQHGRPVRKVVISVQKTGGGWGWAGVKPDREGKFWVHDLPEESVRVEIEGPEIVTAEFRRVDPGPDEITFPVTEKPPATARVIGLVVSAHGEPIGGAQVSLLVDERLGRQKRIDFTHTDGRTGAFRLGPVPPDTCELRIDAPGYARRVLRAIEVASHAECDVGTIALTRGGLVRMQAVGSKPPEARVLVFNARHEWMGDMTSDLSMPLEAAVYEIRSMGAGAADEAHRVVVEEGETSEVILRWRTGRLCKIATQHAASPAARWIEIGVKPSEGRPIIRRVVLHGGETGLAEEAWLAPGACQLFVRDGEYTATTDLVVGDVVGEPLAVNLVCGG